MECVEHERDPWWSRVFEDVAVEDEQGGDGSGRVRCEAQIVRDPEVTPVPVNAHTECIAADPLKGPPN
jgi:hypothetical protein